jgi:hypothetical protein
LTQDDAPALARLLRQSHTMRPEDLPRRVDEAARVLGAAGCRVWLVSRDQRSLQLIGPGRHAGDGLRLDGTVAG